MHTHAHNIIYMLTLAIASAFYGCHRVMQSKRGEPALITLPEKILVIQHQWNSTMSNAPIMLTGFDKQCLQAWQIRYYCYYYYKLAVTINYSRHIHTCSIPIISIHACFATRYRM